MMKFVSGSGGYSVYYAIFGTVEVEQGSLLSSLIYMMGIVEK